MTDQRTPGMDRRHFLAAAGGALTAASAGVTGAEPGGKARGDNPAVGKPASKTAEVQDGQPRVPGPPLPRLGFAVVGLGKLALGEVLPAFALTERCRPTALVSGDPDKARA